MMKKPTWTLEDAIERFKKFGECTTHFPEDVRPPKCGLTITHCKVCKKELKRLYD